MGAVLVSLALFNLGYWGLRVWGHGLWVVYFLLAALVWWRYPGRTVRIRIVVLLMLQLGFEGLPRWVPASYGGGDGGYTWMLFLYWPLSPALGFHSSRPRVGTDSAHLHGLGPCWYGDGPSPNYLFSGQAFLLHDALPLVVNC